LLLVDCTDLLSACADLLSACVGVLCDDDDNDAVPDDKDIDDEEGT
jgi:hypothetical protein